MVVDEIIVYCLIFTCVIFYGYITYLKIIIELKIDNKPITMQNIIFHRRMFLFHVKYKFDIDYPDKQILVLSKQYDKLVPWYYFSFVIIGVFIVIMVLLQNGGL